MSGPYRAAPEGFKPEEVEPIALQPTGPELVERICMEARNGQVVRVGALAGSKILMHFARLTRGKFRQLPIGLYTHRGSCEIHDDKNLGAMDVAL